MTNVVICDDDRVTRGAVTALCEDLGLHVVAETDQWSTSLELVRRFDVDVVVLDLSLIDGSGELVLSGLRDVGASPQVVIFSSFAQDFRRLKQLGAADVVEKPDFDRLAATLERITASTTGAVEEPVSRRTASRATEPLPEHWRSPSGISSHQDLDVSLHHVIERDSILVVALTGVDEMHTRIGPLLVADCHLAVGRALASTLRAQDAIHEHPQANGFVALLRGGSEVAPLAAWRRLLALVDGDALPGQLVGAHSTVDPRGARDAVARVVGELLSGGGLSARMHSR